MQRVLSTVTLVGLLVATAAAFAITEHLKLIKSPIFDAQVTKLFSPTCRCAKSQAEIGFTLRHGDRIAVTIVDSSRDVVATLAASRREPKGPVSFSWSGGVDHGPDVSQGTFQPQVHLFNSRRTILLPNKIVVDTTPPQVVSADAGTGFFSPGDKRTVSIDYVLSEKAHPVLYLDGTRLVRGRHNAPHDTLKWNGKRDGRTLPAGRYVLSLGAVDLAGNTTPSSARLRIVVRIRFIALSANVVRANAGKRFSIGVETAAASYSWRLDKVHGSGRTNVLHLRAPAKRGRYRLVVSEHGHTATATVVVR